MKLKTHIQVLPSLPTEPLKVRQHQLTAIDTLLKSSRYLLHGDPGVGKSLIGLEVIRNAIEAGDKKFLVIAPKAALYVWREDFNLFYHAEDTQCIVLEKGTSAQKRQLLSKLDWNKPTIVVVNYETAWKLKLNLDKFDLAIADESHKLKSHDSKTSKTLAADCWLIPMKYTFTGTPFTERPTDVYGQFRWMTPKVTQLKRGGISRSTVHSQDFGTWNSFFNEYVSYYMWDNIPLVTGYKNLERLANIIKPHYHHIDETQAFDLPEAVNIYRTVPQYPGLSAAYRTLEADKVLELDDALIMPGNAMTHELRLHQLASGYYQGLNPDEPPHRMPNWKQGKAAYVQEILEENNAAPTVVFTTFVEEVAMLAEVIRDMKLKPMFLTGSIQNHEQWQAGEGDVLLVNLQAGSAGVRLTRAHHVIYYSIGNNRTDYVQSLARVRRKGQTASRVFFYYLIMEDTVDANLYARMTAKETNEQQLLLKLGE